jgi:parallel beta-helix repeat protein
VGGSAKNREHKVCPRTGRPIGQARHYRWLRWVFPVVGLASLIWFLVRVIPKPSRATYPCQRFAAPFAGGFVVWLAGIVGSTLAYRKARRLLGQSRYVVAGLFLTLAVGALWLSVSVTSSNRAGAWEPSEPANNPVGVGQGIHPGRVAWVHEPEATHWDGSTGSWWQDENTDPAIVDSMVSQSLRALTGEKDDAASWGALFRHFNATRQLGDVGYLPGEKIIIKINMNQDSGGNWGHTQGMPSPQVIYAMVEQLIDVAGVPGSDITIYDASRYIGDPIYDRIRANPDPDFQDVRIVVRPDLARNGRLGAVHDVDNPIRFANAAIHDNGRAYLPRCVTEAKYMVNMALLRAHSLFGVTLCAKNHFGSTRFPTFSSNLGWTPEPLHNYGSRTNAMGSYNCLVDLIGHAHLGGKTLLYMIDGLYSARNQSVEVIRFQSFGDDWCSSLFVSQDPIAIDSVGLDFIRAEPLAVDCTGRGVDNYLHEAAQAGNPPSGVVYDPEGDGTPLTSLGVHEHWDSPVTKQYSRNLGADEGIELVVPALVTEDGPVQNLTMGTRYDYIRHAVADANEGDEIVVAAGLYRETVDFKGKNVTLRSEDPDDPNTVSATVIDGSVQSVVFSGGESEACVLAGMTITGAAQGVYCDAATPTIRNCRIAGNSEAGVRLWEACDPTLINCIVEGNGGAGVDMAAPRGARFTPYNHATIVHCTIIGNAQGGVIGDKPTIVNSILCDNGCIPGAPQIDGVTLTVDYCLVEGSCPGTGNIDVAPGFVAPGYWTEPTEPDGTGATWVAGDCHLLGESPCIDAGDPDFLVDAATDIDGDPRPAGAGPDLGCDELP